MFCKPELRGSISPSTHRRQMRDLGNNLVLLVFVLAAAAVLFFYACPWMEALGHKYLCH